MFFCDPPGRSDPDALFNYGNDTVEHNYIFFHDQEPIHLDIHKPLFDEVRRRNLDLNHELGPRYKAVITSEKNSVCIDDVVKLYGWHSYYYFYHGWAALDWYRGYDKTFLIAEPSKRKITHSFISPNRIVAGRREHRIILMYHFLQAGLRSAQISFPAICPNENLSVIRAAQHLESRYPGIQNLLANADLPWHFPGESGHPMHSCWLSLFEECSTTLCYLVTETVWQERRLHLTEKTFKPICLGMPFVIASTAGSLAYLRQYGFRTFGSLWDESYDLETDDHQRMKMVADLLIKIDRMSLTEMKELYQRALPIITYNQDHFYNGRFESILWKEMHHMFAQIKQDHAHA